MTRKEFIERGSRIFILALMLGGTGYLAGKRRINPGEYCTDRTRCSACRLKAVCREPLKQTSEKNEEQSI
jgi:hypothetical protein